MTIPLNLPFSPHTSGGVDMSSCLSALCGDTRPGLPPVVLEQRSAQGSQAEWAELLTCRACLTAVDLPFQVLHFRELVQ